MRSRLEAFTEQARRVLEAVTVLTIVAYTILVLLQVIFRYVLNESLFWSEEVVRYGLVWSVMLGSAVVAHDRGHVRIEILAPMMGPRGQAALEATQRACTVMYCMIVTVTGWQFVDRTWFQHSASLDVPMWIFYAAVPVGGALETWFTIFARGQAVNEDGDILI
jgi:C4-dicarboxylate transporter DctQ subunit